MTSKMANKLNHVLVFTTNKSLHERFSTPKQQRSVFVLNDVDTVPCENKDGGETLIDNQMETNETQPPFNKCNVSKNQQMTNNQRPRIVRGSQPVMANALENLAEIGGIKTLPANFRSRQFNSNTPKPGLRYGKYNSIGKRFNGRNRRQKQGNTCSGYNNSGKGYYNWFYPRKWKKQFISKDQLDDEIDKYMAEINPIPLSLTKDECEIGLTGQYRLTDQYLDETERFLKKYEEV